MACIESEISLEFLNELRTELKSDKVSTSNQNARLKTGRPQGTAGDSYSTTGSFRRR